MTSDNATLAPTAPVARPFSGAAITAFVLSLLWLGGLGSLVGLVFAIKGMEDTRTGRRAGQGLAVAALILSILGLLGGVVVIVEILAAGRELQTAFTSVSNSI